MSDDCPCGQRDVRGRPVVYSCCCEPYLSRTALAPDAQALMRSRYSAFDRLDAVYLLDTWHASTRPATLDLDASARWLGLEVRGHRPIADNRAEVEFVARYRVGGRAVRQHELSRFLREGSRWYYVDGDVR